MNGGVTYYSIPPAWIVLLVTAAIWELGWKGLALWRAGRRNEPGWFIALLIINTVGILPIIYLITHTEHFDTEEEDDHEEAVSY